MENSAQMRCLMSSTSNVIHDFYPYEASIFNAIHELLQDRSNYDHQPNLATLLFLVTMRTQVHQIKFMSLLNTTWIMVKRYVAYYAGMLYELQAALRNQHSLLLTRARVSNNAINVDLKCSHRNSRKFLISCKFSVLDPEPAILCLRYEIQISKDIYRMTIQHNIRYNRVQKLLTLIICPSSSPPLGKNVVTTISRHNMVY
jgi:hypothetical protein